MAIGGEAAWLVAAEGGTPKVKPMACAGCCWSPVMRSDLFEQVLAVCGAGTNADGKESVRSAKPVSGALTGLTRATYSFGPIA